jgi:ribonuclease HI
MKRLTVYTDGGFFQDTNVIKWAWLITDGEDIIASGDGSENGGGRGNYDVEKAEATAMKGAIDYIHEHPGNYLLVTDSKSMIDKIQNRCANATKDPTVPYIRRTIDNFRRSPYPISLEISWRKRRSDKWMIEVDDRCS